MNAAAGRVGRWAWAGAVFFVVLLADWALVAAAGTDIPFYDQWDVHGQWLLPGWIDGSLSLRDLAQAHSEHRLVWTHATELLLLRVNGQWDPLVELAVSGLLRASAAALLFAIATPGETPRRQTVIAGLSVLAFLPVAGWHNALWGFQTQVLYVLGFGLLALWGGVGADGRPGRLVLGIAGCLAAPLAMGPGLLLPAALGAVLIIRTAETRRWSWWLTLVILVSLVWTILLRPTVVPPATGLAAASASQFWTALGRALGWPHTAQPWAAVLLNLPAVLAIGGRVLRWRAMAANEDFVTSVFAWAVLIGVGAAWRRGGSAEWDHGVPSRYADLLVLLPLANLWFASALVSEVASTRRTAARWLAGAWSVFLLMGWIGLSAEMTRWVIVPRIRDRDAPVRLMQAYQRTGDPRVFAGQPRLLVPHPNLTVVSSVLHDLRLQGRLPPSLQPDCPPGPLSSLVRRLRPGH